MMVMVSNITLRTARLRSIGSVGHALRNTPEASVDEAQKAMADRGGAGRLPGVDDGRLVGLVVIGQVARRADARDVGER